MDISKITLKLHNEAPNFVETFFDKKMTSNFDFLNSFFQKEGLELKTKYIGLDSIHSSESIQIVEVYHRYTYGKITLIVFPNNSFSRRQILYRLTKEMFSIDKLCPECIDFKIDPKNIHEQIYVLGKKEQIKEFNEKFVTYINEKYKQYLLFLKEKNIVKENYKDCFIFLADRGEDNIGKLHILNREKSILPTQSYYYINSYLFGKIYEHSSSRISIDCSLENSLKAIHDLNEYKINNKTLDLILKLNPIRIIELLIEDLKKISPKFNVENFVIEKGNMSLGRLTKSNVGLQSKTSYHDYINISPCISYSSEIFFRGSEIFLELVDDKLMLHHSVWCQRTTNWSHSIGVDQEFSIFRFFDWMINQFLPSSPGHSKLAFLKYPEDLTQFRLPNKKVSKGEILNRINKFQNI